MRPFTSYQSTSACLSRMDYCKPNRTPLLMQRGAVFLELLLNQRNKHALDRVNDAVQ